MKKTMRQPQKIKKISVDDIPAKHDKKQPEQPVKQMHHLILRKKFVLTKQQESEKAEQTVKTSKLEYFFADNFLKKLGLKYIHQWTCNKTKFIYDFAILTPDGGDYQSLCEIDGDYYHANPLLTEKQGFLYENQKRQIERDKAKDEWAAMNGFVLIRFFEHEIKNSPRKVLEELRKRLYCSEKKSI
jgi:very-short-patch-repair endonuclease